MVSQLHVMLRTPRVVPGRLNLVLIMAYTRTAVRLYSVACMIDDTYVMFDMAGYGVSNTTNNVFPTHTIVAHTRGLTRIETLVCVCARGARRKVRKPNVILQCNQRMSVVGNIRNSHTSASFAPSRP